MLCSISTVKYRYVGIQYYNRIKKTLVQVFIDGAHVSQAEKQTYRIMQLNNSCPTKSMHQCLKTKIALYQ